MVTDSFQCNTGIAETQIDKLGYTGKSSHYTDFFEVRYILGILAGSGDGLQMIFL